MLWTGLRRGDAAIVGPSHVKDGVIILKTEKTGAPVAIRILPPLARSIAATHCGRETFVARLDGSPMVKEGFGNWFGEACRAAGVPGSAHGLRKALAARVAESGATQSELDALFAWSGGGMSSLYTRKASREKLAESALARLGYSLTPES
jgi:integrase